MAKSGDTVASAVMSLIGLAVFAACVAICLMVLASPSPGLPGGETMLPVIGFVGSLAMMAVATWRLVVLRRQGDA